MDNYPFTQEPQNGGARTIQEPLLRAEFPVKFNPNLIRIAEKLQAGPLQIEAAPIHSEWKESFPNVWNPAIAHEKKSGRRILFDVGNLPSPETQKTHHRDLQEPGHAHEEQPDLAPEIDLAGGLLGSGMGGSCFAEVRIRRRQRRADGGYETCWRRWRPRRRCGGGVVRVVFWPVPGPVRVPGRRGGIDGDGRFDHNDGCDQNR